MCNKDCLKFVAENLLREEAEGKAAIESGGRNVNGTVRPIVEACNPASYISTDIAAGEGVDFITDAEELVEVFGEKSFDLLLSTEVIEHVENWRVVISNYKNILRPGGVLFITTRSFGFGWHGYPHDYWRYEIEDMREIFSDFEIMALYADPYEPGVFIKAKRPKKFVERDLSDYKLYSINALERTL